MLTDVHFSKMKAKCSSRMLFATLKTSGAEKLLQLLILPQIFKGARR